MGLVFALLAGIGSVWAWLGARSHVVVAPVTSGEPSTTSVAYYPPLIFLALLLATIAGVLAVLALSNRAEVHA